jgi:hypothetical protein
MKTFTPRNCNRFLNSIGKSNSSRSFHSVQTSLKYRTMSTSTSDLKIENTNIKSATGVDLSSQQKTLVGSVLDLFAGRPSLEKLQLWTDEAVFEDPITIARGRKQFEPQWVCKSCSVSSGMTNVSCKVRPPNSLFRNREDLTRSDLFRQPNHHESQDEVRDQGHRKGANHRLCRDHQDYRRWNQD